MNNKRKKGKATIISLVAAVCLYFVVQEYTKAYNEVWGMLAVALFLISYGAGAMLVGLYYAEYEPVAPRSPVVSRPPVDMPTGQPVRENKRLRPVRKYPDVRPVRENPGLHPVRESPERRHSRIRQRPPVPVRNRNNHVQ